MRKVFPNAEDNLIHNLERFKDISVLYQQAMEVHKKRLIVRKGTEIFIPVLKLERSEPLRTIIYEIIKDFGFTAHQSTDVVKLLTAETGKYVQSSTHRILKNRNWLIISPNITTEADNILIEESDHAVVFGEGKVEIKKLQSTPNYKPQTPNNIAHLDASKIKFPLLLRKWKKGDYFYPLGMNKKKKLSRFFIDQKLSLSQKEKTWVIEMDAKIIWVVGMRIDDRCKLSDNTMDVLQIKLTAF